MTSLTKIKDAKTCRNKSGQWNPKTHSCEERYFVDWSSWFTTHDYNVPLLKKAVKSGGGKNIRLSYNYGWSNQPKVVCFNADEHTKEKVEKHVEKAVGTPWIIIRKKDW